MAAHLLITLQTLRPGLSRAQALNQFRRVSALPDSIGCHLRITSLVGVCLMLQLMYLGEHHLLLTQAEPLPAALLLQKAITAAANLMTLLLKDAEMALVREDLIGMAINV